MSDLEAPDSGGFDLGQLLAQAQQMQADMADAQERAASEVVTGSSGGGLVHVELTGAMQAVSVRIDRTAVPGLESSDVEVLEDLVLAAVRDALNQAAALGSEAVTGALGGLGGLGGLGDLGKFFG